MISTSVWSSATKLSSSFLYRTSRFRNRLNLLWQTSTTQPGLLVQVTLLGIGLFATTNDMSDVDVRLDDLQCTPASIASLGEQIIAAPRLGSRVRRLAARYLVRPAVFMARRQKPSQFAQFRPDCRTRSGTRGSLCCERVRQGSHKQKPSRIRGELPSRAKADIACRVRHRQPPKA